MEIPNKSMRATVVECFHQDAHQVIVANIPCLRTGVNAQFFLYASIHPNINFGDTIILTEDTTKIILYRGNPRLSYNIHLDEFPLDLLQTLLINSPLIQKGL